MAPPPPTSTLHVLKREDVNRICSGQSVVDLATCVKELVENALDAGATQIDVKLKEYGRDAIEVSDNGAGVAAPNYASLARKHYTSKISAFEDIASVASFGFRGEALSSICQLVSSFTVCTRTAEDELGTLLTYDRSGELISQTKKARPVGTTIVVEDLFKPLPVRSKDFHRNIKKHYAKLLKVLQAYAVSCVRVKISVSNASGKGGSNRQVVLATQAHQSMGDNIASVFGTKFFRTLKSVDFDLNETWPQVSEKTKAASTPSKEHHVFDRSGHSQADTQDDQEESKDGDEDGDDEGALSQHSITLERKVVGFVSKVGEGVGRSDNDRQFFFINSRPFDLPKLSKAVNDVWRQFEMKQKPACVLNFLLPSGEFDVNVTPDKRETFVKNEAHIIESFKTQLTRMYEPSRGTFFVQPLLTAFAKPSDHMTSQPTSPVDSQPEESQEMDTNGSTRSGQSDPALLAPSQRIGGLTITFEPLPPPQLGMNGAESGGPARSHCCAGHDSDRERDNDGDIGTVDGGSVVQATLTVEDETNDIEMLEHKIQQEQPRYLAYSPKKPPSSPADSDGPPHKKQRSTYAASAQEDHEVVQISRVRSSGAPAPRQVDALMGEWSFAEMKRQRETFFKQEVEVEERRSQRSTRRLSISKANHADALEPDNDLAAAALQRVLKKDDFRRMQVVGQFNLGFVIGKLDDDDLFIIDQHASDEKFNYETLQQTTVLHQQPLVRPLPLELTAGEEMVILDHLDVFTRHGFTFLVRKDAPPTKKLQLLSLPFSKQTQFGVDDIRELASLLMDTPLNPRNVRLPKLMAMFASRACRSSIMIGTALHKEEMQKIVRNLASLEQPWNCPHGRPTLRHLLDIAQLEDSHL